MQKFEHTLNILGRKREAYETQLRRIEKMERFLQEARVGNMPTDLKFEVHFQCRWPDHYPIKTISNSLIEAYKKAESLWKAYNATSGQPRTGPADIFVHIDGMLMVISHVDAANIANAESRGQKFSSEQFTFDNRLLEKVGTTIWSADEDLPGWHASELTPEKNVEVEAEPASNAS